MSLDVITLLIAGIFIVAIVLLLIETQKSQKRYQVKLNQLDEMHTVSCDTTMDHHQKIKELAKIVRKYESL